MNLASYIIALFHLEAEEGVPGVENEAPAVEEAKGVPVGMVALQRARKAKKALSHSTLRNKQLLYYALRHDLARPVDEARVSCRMI